MERLNTGDSDRLVHAFFDGGCVSLLGVPFLAVGCFIEGMALSGKMKPPPGFSSGEVFGALFGAPFLLIGLAVLLGRTGILFDRRAGSFCRWWGVATPWVRAPLSLHSPPISLESFARVKLTRESRSIGRNSSQMIVYVVRMAGDGTPQFPGAVSGKDLPQFLASSDGSVEVNAYGSELEARHFAEVLAGFLRFPLEDATGGPGFVHPPDTLNQLLRARVRQSGEPVVLPPPQDARSTVRHEGDQTIIEIPRERIDPSIFAPLVILGVVALYIGVSLQSAIVSGHAPADARSIEASGSAAPGSQPTHDPGEITGSRRPSLAMKRHPGDTHRGAAGASSERKPFQQKPLQPLAPAALSTVTPEAQAAKVIVGIALAIGLLLAVAQVSLGSTVHASATELRITTRRPASTASTGIPVAELKELLVSAERRAIMDEAQGRQPARRSRPVLKAISDREIVRFGSGLTISELEWLRSVIVKSLAS